MEKRSYDRLGCSRTGFFNGNSFVTCHFDKAKKSEEKTIETLQHNFASEEYKDERR